MRKGQDALVRVSLKPPVDVAALPLKDQGTITVQIDDAHRGDVELKVAGGDKLWRLGAKTDWSISLADGQYDIEVTGEGRFRVDKDSVTVRRGQDAVVRVVATAPVDSVGERAVAWVAANNAVGPQAVIVSDARKNVLSQTSQGRGFIYYLPGPLLTSGKSTVLTVYGNEMFTHELSPDRAKLMGFTGERVAWFTKGLKQIGTRSAQPEFRLLPLRLDHEDALGKNGSLTGWVDYDRLRQNEDSQVHYWLRVTLTIRRVDTMWLGLRGGLEDEKGSVRLSFENPLPAGATVDAMLMFVEFGKFVGDDDNFDNFVALSDPVSSVITLHPREE